MKSKLKHTINKSGSKEKAITIEAELPIPLGELAIYVLKKGDDENCLLDLLYNKPEVVNIQVRKIIKEIICKKKLEIKLKELKFDYNDSDRFSHGASYFKAKLRGTEKSLKKIAGEDRIFFFNWQEYEQSINSDTV